MTNLEARIMAERKLLCTVSARYEKLKQDNAKRSAKSTLKPEQSCAEEFAYDKVARHKEYLAELIEEEKLERQGVKSELGLAVLCPCCEKLMTVELGCDDKEARKTLRRLFPALRLYAFTGETVCSCGSGVTVTVTVVGGKAID